MPGGSRSAYLQPVQPALRLGGSGEPGAGQSGSASCVKCPEIGSWPRAKYLAGLIDEDVLVRSHGARPYSERELVKALVEAVAEVGPDISRASYATWREQRLADARGEERIPSEALLRQRFGKGRRTWAAVLSNGLKRAAELRIEVPGEQAR